MGIELAADPKRPLRQVHYAAAEPGFCRVPGFQRELSNTKDQPMAPTRSVLAALAASATAALALSACGSTARKASDSASAKSCSKSSLELEKPGQLTIATDAPAYSPYFVKNDPSDGEGFESAVAYAIGEKLGFSHGEVEWVVEPFDSSYAPGPKSFDFDINEISITPARAKEVDFSVPYYTDPQGIIVAAGSKYANVKSLSSLKDAKIGVQIGTTSLEAVEKLIDPTNQIQVFNDADDVTSAFNDHTVEAIVVDLATGFELVEDEVKEGKLVGQFNAPGGDNWGVLLGKGSNLTHCVDGAIEALKSDGTLAKLNSRWMASSAGVPKLN
jgi:polar amino acid transport system substrate-binding protein